MTKKTTSNKNSNYVRFNRNSLMDIAELGNENPSAFEVFMFIAKNMGTNNVLCIDMKALEKALGLSRNTLSETIKYLEENKWIIINKLDTSNVDTINPFKAVAGNAIKQNIFNRKKV